MVADTTVDENTVVVEVVVGLTSDTAVLAAGAKTIDVEVNHDGTVITVNPGFTVTHDTSGINNVSRRGQGQGRIVRSE